MNENLREKVIALSEAITKTEEYVDFLEKEEVLKADEETQKLLLDFQQKQQDFIAKQMSGEVDQDLLNQLSGLQNELRSRESLTNFLDSYSRLLDLLGEVTDLMSEKLNVDMADVFRQR
ncbi:hypothetical protein Asulf_01829 [Archaeoglobus sulfaticallidus PM70-1]|uniref:Uncharacterized protein n=1 Tax=Archaeoglobus sulfaticallidus PM70-1 TaxID=387631 RepID=N0BNB2_9EURY|nr:YlbF family regulator [Archaeoglobus sulfaticallidus]AGK61800.1 hypothetical protein Asulf_01829 [Archaeoglobus sulfaticallidus PM70-1]